MTKKVVKKIWDDKKIKWFKGTCEKWIKIYHLSDWVVIFEFSEESYKDNEGDRTTLATCTPDSIYHEAKISFYPEILKSSKESWSGKYVENKIKHELCHMMTEKIAALALDRHTTKDQIDNEIESLTQLISIIT